jgi:hypothetical protein
MIRENIVINNRDYFLTNATLLDLLATRNLFLMPYGGIVSASSPLQFFHDLDLHIHDDNDDDDNNADEQLIDL